MDKIVYNHVEHKLCIVPVTGNIVTGVPLLSVHHAMFI